MLQGKLKRGTERQGRNRRFSPLSPGQIPKSCPLGSNERRTLDSTGHQFDENFLPKAVELSSEIGHFPGAIPTKTAMEPNEPTYASHYMVRLDFTSYVDMGRNMIQLEEKLLRDSVKIHPNSRRARSYPTLEMVLH